MYSFGTVTLLLTYIELLSDETGSIKTCTELFLTNTVNAESWHSAKKETFKRGITRNRIYTSGYFDFYLFSTKGRYLIDEPI